MSPAANTPGMLVSMVWDTLISPFSMSRPHWAIAPSEEMKPSCGITQSTATRSSSLVLLLQMVTASIVSPPWMAFSSQKVRSSIFPAAHRSEEHTSELQSPCNLVCRLLLEKKKKVAIVDYDVERDHDIFV